MWICWTVSPFPKGKGRFTLRTYLLNNSFILLLLQWLIYLSYSKRGNRSLKPPVLDFWGPYLSRFWSPITCKMYSKITYTVCCFTSFNMCVSNKKMSADGWWVSEGIESPSHHSSLYCEKPVLHIPTPQHTNSTGGKKNQTQNKSIKMFKSKPKRMKLLLPTEIFLLESFFSPISVVKILIP